MSKISGKNTKPELALRRALYGSGLRYRLHDIRIVGKPDIVFRKYKTVIFVDGDWWHGRNYEVEYERYTPFWQNKIKVNMLRDEKVTRQLVNEGWTVIRIWEKDLLKNPQEFAARIKGQLNGSGSSPSA